VSDPAIGRPSQPIRSPRGSALSCKGWPQEAALRMLMNNQEQALGSLEPGKQADVLILGIARHEDIAHRIGSNLVERVIKRGQVVVER